MPYWFDGNNLIGQSAESARTERSTRRAFLEHLAGVARSRGGRFLVFFDGEDLDRSLPPRGLALRYCAPLSADEVMLQALAGARLPSEVIVVTNDLGLRKRCRDAGAQVRSWREFESLAAGRTATMPGNYAPSDPVDVREWQRYFGLDDTELE